MFYNLPKKPYGLSSIILASMCELWWQGIFQYQSSIIVLINRKIKCCFSYGDFYCFPKRFSRTYHRLPRLAATAPSTKATCPGYGHYRVLSTAGVGPGQTREDRQALHGVRKQ